MLTPDEYMAIMRLISSERELEGASLADRDKSTDNKPRRKRRTAYSRALSKALVNENAKQRKKNGQFKAGKSAKTVLSKAHRIARRMTKK